MPLSVPPDLDRIDGNIKHHSGPFAETGLGPYCYSIHTNDSLFLVVAGCQPGGKALEIAQRSGSPTAALFSRPSVAHLVEHFVETRPFRRSARGNSWNGL